MTAPLWFKAPFKVLRLFVREKLRDRVFTVSIPQVGRQDTRTSLVTTQTSNVGTFIDIKVIQSEEQILFSEFSEK